MTNNSLFSGQRHQNEEEDLLLYEYETRSDVILISPGFNLVQERLWVIPRKVSRPLRHYIGVNRTNTYFDSFVNCHRLAHHDLHVYAKLLDCMMFPLISMM